MDVLSSVCDVWVLGGETDVTGVPLGLTGGDAAAIVAGGACGRLRMQLPCRFDFMGDCVGSPP